LKAITTSNLVISVKSFLPNALLATIISVYLECTAKGATAQSRLVGLKGLQFGGPFGGRFFHLLQ